MDNSHLTSPGNETGTARVMEGQRSLDGETEDWSLGEQMADEKKYSWWYTRDTPSSVMRPELGHKPDLVTAEEESTKL